MKKNIHFFSQDEHISKRGFLKNFSIRHTVEGYSTGKTKGIAFCLPVKFVENGKIRLFQDNLRAFGNIHMALLYFFPGSPVLPQFFLRRGQTLLGVDDLENVGHLFDLGIRHMAEDIAVEVDVAALPIGISAILGPQPHQTETGIGDEQSDNC